MATTLRVGEIYNPLQGADSSHSTGYSPQARDPLKPTAFVVKETPFVNNLRCVLSLLTYSKTFLQGTL